MQLRNEDQDGRSSSHMETTDTTSLRVCSTTQEILRANGTNETKGKVAQNQKYKSINERQNAKKYKGTNTTAQYPNVCWLNGGEVDPI